MQNKITPFMIINRQNNNLKFKKILWLKHKIFKMIIIFFIQILKIRNFMQVNSRIGL